MHAVHFFTIRCTPSPLLCFLQTILPTHTVHYSAICCTPLLPSFSSRRRCCLMVCARSSPEALSTPVPSAEIYSQAAFGSVKQDTLPLLQRWRGFILYPLGEGNH